MMRKPPASARQEKTPWLERLDKGLAIVPSIAAAAAAIGPWKDRALIAFYDHPYEVLALLWIISMVGMVRWILRLNDRKRHPPLGARRVGRADYALPIGIGVAVTLLAGASCWYVHHLVNTPVKYQAPSASYLDFALPADAATLSFPSASVDVIADASSLTGIHQGNLFIVEPDPDIEEALAFQKGRESDDPTFYQPIVDWLRARTDQVGKPHDRLFLADGVNLVQLTYDHSNTVNDLRPASQAELDKLPSDQQEIVGRWLTHDVGQWEIALRVSVDNTGGTRKFLVHSLRLHVMALKERKGVAPKLLNFPYVSATLPYATGDTDLRFLETGPELTVPAGGSATFNVLITAPKNAPLLPEWDGDMSLETSIGSVPLGKFVLATYNTQLGPGPSRK